MVKLEQDRLTLWTLVCLASGAPSLCWSVIGVPLNRYALVIGIGFFIVLYTVLTSGSFYEKLQKNIVWFSALKWAFKIRIWYSIISLVAMLLAQGERGGGHSPSILQYNLLMINSVDIYFLHINALVSEFLLGENLFLSYIGIGSDAAFLPTFVATITQGILLSLAILLVAAIIWCFLRVKNNISSRHPARSEATAQDLDIDN